MRRADASRHGCTREVRAPANCRYRRPPQAGKHPGRPADLIPEKVDNARQMIDSGEQSFTGLAEILDVHQVMLQCLQR
jgi:hypothetical protein